jgi:thiol-disulfide isomerase/thioredoxin
VPSGGGPATIAAVRVVLLVVLVVACSAPPRPVHEPVITPVDEPRGESRLGTLGALEASVDLDGKVVGSSPASATIVVLFASWCGHCRVELEVIAKLLPSHPDTRVLGVNYRSHEEYDGRGDSEAVRRFLAEHAPWLRVVPADERLFEILGRPPKVPTLYIYDRTGTLVEIYDRRDRAMPDADELGAVLGKLERQSSGAARPRRNPA